MNCFNHQTNSANSQCVICHKGLCEQCHHTKDELSVCNSKTCEKRALGYLGALSHFDYKSSSGVLLLFAGLGFIGVGIFGILHNRSGNIPFIEISLICFGLLYVKPLLKFINDKSKPKPDSNAKWN